MIVLADKRYCRRRGSVTHEMSVAVLLAAAVVLGVAQLASLVAHQRSALDRRAAAHRTAGNLMESMMARPWEQLTAQPAADEETAEPAEEELGEAELAGGRLSVEVVQEPDSPAKRITIEVNWPASSQPPAAPIRLVAWRYPAVEATP